MLFSSQLLAQPQWYRGVVNRVSLLRTDGSLIVTLDDEQLADCKYCYAYYEVSKLGAERVKAAHAMALVSITSKIKVGVVIDKATRASDEICYASGMTADLRSD